MLAKRVIAVATAAALPICLLTGCKTPKDDEDKKDDKDKKDKKDKTDDKDQKDDKKPTKDDKDNIDKNPENSGEWSSLVEYINGHNDFKGKNAKADALDFFEKQFSSKVKTVSGNDIFPKSPEGATITALFHDIDNDSKNAAVVANEMFDADKWDDAFRGSNGKVLRTQFDIGVADGFEGLVQERDHIYVADPKLVRNKGSAFTRAVWFKYHVEGGATPRGEEEVKDMDRSDKKSKKVHDRPPSMAVVWDNLYPNRCRNNYGIAIMSPENPKCPKACFISAKRTFDVVFMLVANSKWMQSTGAQHWEKESFDKLKADPSRDVGSTPNWWGMYADFDNKKPINTSDNDPDLEPGIGGHSPQVEGSYTDSEASAALKNIHSAMKKFIEFKKTVHRGNTDWDFDDVTHRMYNLNLGINAGFDYVGKTDPEKYGTDGAVPGPKQGKPKTEHYIAATKGSRSSLYWRVYAAWHNGKADGQKWATSIKEEFPMVDSGKDGAILSSNWYVPYNHIVHDILYAESKQYAMAVHEVQKAINAFYADDKDFKDKAKSQAVFKTGGDNAKQLGSVNPEFMKNYELSACFYTWETGGNAVGERPLKTRANNAILGYNPGAMDRDADACTITADDAWDNSNRGGAFGAAGGATAQPEFFDFDAATIAGGPDAADEFKKYGRKEATATDANAWKGKHPKSLMKAYGANDATHEKSRQIPVWNELMNFLAEVESTSDIDRFVPSDKAHWEKKSGSMPALGDDEVEWPEYFFPSERYLHSLEVKAVYLPQPASSEEIVGAVYAGMGLAFMDYYEKRVKSAEFFLAKSDKACDTKDRKEKYEVSRSFDLDETLANRIPEIQLGGDWKEGIKKAKSLFSKDDN